MDPALLDVVAPVHLPKLAVVTFVINALMFGVKRDRHIPDWTIPFLSLGFGALLYPLWVGWSGETAFLGALAGIVSVGGHQFLRQGREALGKKPPGPNSNSDKKP